MSRLRRIFVLLGLTTFFFLSSFIGEYTLSAHDSDDRGVSEWSAYGRTPFEDRFSPLAQINSRTVSTLGIKWYRDLDTDRGQEATPIMVDGVLYISTAWSKVFAFDARDGKELWRYDPEVPPQTLGKTCCDAVNRGVAVSDGRVFVGTLDGRLIALNAKNGRVIWSVLTVDISKPYTITGAPRIAKGKVLIGNSGAEYGVRGYLSAYDVTNGKLAWRFYTVPSADGKPDGQPSDKILRDAAAPTWFGDGWKKTGGGGTVWDAIAYDPESDLLYFGVGNGTPWNYNIRSDGKGDNLFLSSIIAVRPETGEYVWHYQTTPGEAWDYTATQQIILADIPIDGKIRKVLMQAPKNGFFYVLDRLTGHLLTAQPYVPVNWAKGVDLTTGKPDVVPEARYAKKGWLLEPGPTGAHSWHPMAFSPRTGLVYIPAQHISAPLGPPKEFKFRPGHANVGIDLSTVDLPSDPAQIEQFKKSVYGELIAWDPASQKMIWTVRHNYFLNGGVLTTAGDLVFQGTIEGQLIAYDARTGRKVWSFDVDSGIVAAPISYAIAGQQYIAVMVGAGGFGVMLGTVTPDRPRLPGRLIVFSLGGKQKLAHQAAASAVPINLENLNSTGDPVRGAALYNDTCLSCHGLGAASGFNADLRRSATLGSAEAWRSVVIDGALEERGMISFRKYISDAEAEDIRAYVITKARLTGTSKIH